MELAEYFFRTKKTQRELAKKCHLQANSICSYSNLKTSPSLLAALKIYLETEGRVSLLELLRPEEREDLYKIFGKENVKEKLSTPNKSKDSKKTL